MPTLTPPGRAAVFAAGSSADGAVTVEFGDGEQGARLPTGRNNVTATYRVGGGAEGEVATGRDRHAARAASAASRRCAAPGPTEGGADQDDERRLRRLAPTRARAFGRVVSAEDLVDLALGYPGVIARRRLAAAPGPPGCACGGIGLHLAFLRTGAGGPAAAAAGRDRARSRPTSTRRRDATVPLCVCAGTVTAPAADSAALAVDPRRDAGAVAAAVAAALADPDGPLAPGHRALGQPLDRSDVFAVIHGVAGVVGVTTLDAPPARRGELGRRRRARWELLVPVATTPPSTGAVPA